MFSIDLVGSLIIGGLVLLLILGFTFWYMNNSRDMIIDESQKSMATNIGDIIEDDFLHIGYGMEGSGLAKVVSWDSTHIEFHSDLDNNGTIENVRYEKQQSRKGAVLVRNVNQGEPEFVIPVLRFQIVGYDSLGVSSPPPSPAELDQIKYTILFAESFFTQVNYSKKGGGGFYTKHIIPNNL